MLVQFESPYTLEPLIWFSEAELIWVALRGLTSPTRNGFSRVQIDFITLHWWVQPVGRHKHLRFHIS